MRVYIVYSKWWWMLQSGGCNGVKRRRVRVKWLFLRLFKMADTVKVNDPNIILTIYFNQFRVNRIVVFVCLGIIFCSIMCILCIRIMMLVYTQRNGERMSTSIFCNIISYFMCNKHIVCGRLFFGDKIMSIEINTE